MFVCFCAVDLSNPDTEVALNLICVSEATRKNHEHPNRTRSLKDYVDEVNKSKRNHKDANKTDGDNSKTYLDKKNTNSKLGKYFV